MSGSGSFNDKLLRVFRDGGVYLAFNIANRAIPFLLLPILTRYIDPYGYGVITVVGMITAVAMPILGMCSNTVLYQRYFKISPAQRSQFVNDAYKVTAFNTLLICILVLLFSGVFQYYFELSFLWVEVAILISGFGMVYAITNTLFLIRKSPFQYGFFQLLSILVNVSLSLLFVVSLELSWEGRILALFVAGFLMMLVAFYINFREGDLRLADTKHVGQIGDIARLGGALIPGAISGWAVLMVDRMLLASLTTLEITGVYAIGLMIAQITDVILASLTRAFQPYLFEYGASTEHTRRLRVAQGIYVYFFLALLIAGVIFLVSPLVLKLMIDERYWSAIEVIGWLSLSFAFFNIGSVFMNLILLAEKNSLTIYVGLLCIAVSAVGGYFMIQEFGMVGAAISNCLTSAIYMMTMFLVSLRYNAFPWFDRGVFSLSFRN